MPDTKQNQARAALITGAGRRIGRAIALTLSHAGYALALGLLLIFGLWLRISGTIMCLPTTPFPALKKGLPLPVLGPLRDRISCLCSHGGLTGVPQVSIPGAEVDGLPVGLSIVGGRGSDASLVAVARHLVP